ncbi:carbon-nitrogen hydrolase family protein [Infirmifilum lucidum]|uniref:Carbon-nitrogen hydrolase family protein n=1 Tax=Infirmifilum lucidum TaxID=2776706 RepID=A0A7L9FHF7_9CREN|nr:carbon-nitrogen hydrolase family protein [Infirmifilum lucidum]QOJ79199.1 carbon-nitrogen hydrolase family protein [Infirmifilum lucidum]
MKLVAVQYEFKPESYTDVKAFYESLEEPLLEAESRLGSIEDSIVVYPEHVGTFLVFLDEKLHEETLERELARIALRSLPTFLLKTLQTLSPRYALVSIKWKNMRKAYFDSFSKLASSHRAVIVAGSILEPSAPRSIHNVSYVFNSDGRAKCRQVKVYLDIPEAKLGVSPGRLDEIDVCETPLARLGVAICLDAFKEDVVSRLASRGATVLVQPSANPEPWSERLEKEWRNSSWLMVQKFDPLVYGINPMAVGRVLGLEFEGISSIVAKASITPDGSGYLARAKSPKSKGVLAVSTQE